MAYPEGSPKFREAKLAVWRKHASEITNDVIANAFERQKRRLNVLFDSTVDARGARAHLERDVTRLEREKATLLAKLQEQQNDLNGAAIRTNALEASMAAAREAATNALREVATDEAEIARLTGRTRELESAFTEHTTTIQALYNEIGRLQNLLEMIYSSRTWKLHTIMERMKGRT